MIIETTIAKETKLPSTGHKYFKGIIMDRGVHKKFLKPDHLDLDSMKGISRGYIKDYYFTMLVFLHTFLTCEGRYALTFIYHLRLLLHFEGGPYIEFPHFLWVSLNKMVRGVKSTSKKLKTSIYHHGKMKLLVFHELRKQNISWKKFLTEKFSYDTSKSVEGSVIGEHSKGSDRKKGKKINKTMDNVGPISL
jgi:hypothetical protein